MPAKSKSQFRLMKGIASGSIKPKGGLDPASAQEFVSGQSPKGLPETASKMQRARQKRIAKKPPKK